MQSTRELRSLCASLGLAEEGGRAELHARLLGLSAADFEALHAAAGPESEAEHEALWMDDGE